MHKPSQPTSSRALLYTLILMPIVAFYTVFVVRYGQTYLLRRDENIMLEILAELQRGQDINDIFTMVITPSFLRVMLSLVRFVNVLLLGRLLCMLSALTSALLSTYIAYRLFPRVLVIPPLVLALMLSSALFVQEGTIFRLDLLSLALSLGGIALLIPTETTSVSGTAWRVLLAGFLFGTALEVKPLMLAVMPFVLYLLWSNALLLRDAPAYRSRIVTMVMLHGVGWLLPAVLTIALIGWDSIRVGSQLGEHLQASNQLDLATRIGHSVAVSLEFVQNHFWMLLFFVFAASSIQRTPETRGENPSAYRIALIWAGTLFAVLFVNFPTWDHHFVYLLPPLAIGAALFLATVGSILFHSETKENSRNRLVFAVICVSIATVGTFTTANALDNQQITPDITAVAAQVAVRTSTGDRIWADNQLFPLLSSRSNAPQLIDFSVKRIIAGELPEQELFDLFKREPPVAVIAYDGLFNAFPHFTDCLSRVSDITVISLNNQQVYWVRRADMPTFIACAEKMHSNQ